MPPSKISRRLKKVRVVQHAWEAGWIPFSGLVEELPATLTDLGVLLLVDVDDGTVIAAEPIGPETPGQIARRILEFTLRPMFRGVPQRPKLLRVRDADLAEPLRAETGGELPEIAVVEQFERLDSIAADLARSLSSRAKVDLPPLPDWPEMAALFRSAVVFYNARPWRVISDDVVLRIDIGSRPPLFGSVLGGASLAYGLALFPDAGALRALLEGADETYPTRSLAVTFVPEADLPDSWRTLRRARRWPIASPSAFPMPMLWNGPDGQIPAVEEAATLELALSGVAALVATHSAQLKRGIPCVHTRELTDAAGAPYRVSITGFANVLEEPDATPLGEGGRIAALDEVRLRALALPEARAIIARLAWSFFRNSAPDYVKGEEERASAYGRFLDWAVFVAKPGGETLAARSVEAAGDELDADTLEECRHLIHPRAGIFRVERVDRDVGLHVLDEASDEKLFIRERLATRQVRRDQTILGVLHPVSDDVYVMAPSSLVLPRVAERTGAPPVLGNLEQFAPALEAAWFSASEKWVQRATPDHLHSAYEDFRDAILATGGKLPTWNKLRRDIRSANSPMDVFRAIGNAVEWWTEMEFEVMAALLMSIWNSTPRPELQEKTPDQAARKRR